MRHEPDLEARPVGRNPKIRRGRVRSQTYVLHGFEPWKSTVLDTHRARIKQIARAIDRSYRTGRPLARISITGHAAYYDKVPNPKIPYRQQGLNRAKTVAAELRKELGRPAYGSARNAPLISRVEIAPPRTKGTDSPIATTATPDGRRYNRRAEVTISEWDPDLAPFRWICRIECAYAPGTSPIYNRQPPAQGILRGTATGVLISDRHVLTAAHNVRVVKQIKRGTKTAYIVEEPTEIRVTPAFRGGHHVAAPHGRWKVEPGRVRLFDDPNRRGPHRRSQLGGFASATRSPFVTGTVFRPGAWDANDRATANLNAFLRDHDLAIIEVTGKAGRYPGQARLRRSGRLGWWGRSPGFPIGITGRIKRFAALKDASQRAHVRVLGYPNGAPDFRIGTVRREGFGLRSDNLGLQTGHSGSPYWMTFGTGESRLVGIHKGNEQGADWGMLLSPAVELWINSVIGR